MMMKPKVLMNSALRVGRDLGSACGVLGAVLLVC
jgi:hypothetical protein